MKEKLITYRDGGNLRIRVTRDAPHDKEIRIFADPSDPSWTDKGHKESQYRLFDNGSGLTILGLGRRPFMRLDYDVAAEVYELLRFVHEDDQPAYRESTTRYDLKETF